MSKVQFTPCQAKALHVLEGTDNVFLTGAAGTGKSFLLQQFLRSKGQRSYPVLASTGTAALLIDGRTFHSFFGLGIMEGGLQATVARAVNNKKIHARMQQARGVIIDEVSMLSGEALATAEAIARRIRDNDEPWGGLRVIAVGDFAQLPPVQPSHTEKDWAFLHPVWLATNFTPVYLETMVRSTDEYFLAALNDVREGIVTQTVKELLSERASEPDLFFDGTRLFPHRRSADSYNQQRLDRIDGSLVSYETDYEGSEYHFAQLKKQCPVPEVLHLKVGALVMIRKNDPSYPYKYVNGTLGTVTSMASDIVHLRLMDGESVEIKKEVFQLFDGNGEELASAYNFPLNLAWATTIHKSQGASISRLMVNISNLWESGHAYTALSRARSADGLYVESWDERSIFSDSFVQNLYTEIIAEWRALAASLPSEPPEILEVKDEPKPTNGKVKNHYLTYELLRQERPLDEICETLGWTFGTILRHIQKLAQEGKELDIEYLRPDSSVYTDIAGTFMELGTDNLKPVHQALGGKYTYDQIKQVQLFMALDQLEVEAVFA